MRYWWTADTHLGHKNIIEYCNRPFTSLEQMNETIIRRWNERVRPEDTVFCVGDFCFKNSPGGKEGEGALTSSAEYEKLLNGKIIHIKGNHDKNNSTKTIITSLVVSYGNHIVKLLHDSEFDNLDCKIAFCGHIHEKWKFKRVTRGWGMTDYINVGVDVWNFYPRTFEEIYREYKKWLKAGCK